MDGSTPRSRACISTARLRVQSRTEEGISFVLEGFGPTGPAETDVFSLERIDREVPSGSPSVYAVYDPLREAGTIEPRQRLLRPEAIDEHQLTRGVHRAVLGVRKRREGCPNPLHHRLYRPVPGMIGLYVEETPVDNTATSVANHR